MAQDTNLRHMRSDDPYPRDPAPASGGRSDPLAELARLIGQNDPFGDPSRQDGRAASRPAAQPASRTAPDWLARPGPSTRQADPAPSYDDQWSGHGTQKPHPAGYDDGNYQRDARYEAQPQEAYQGEYAAEGQENAAYGYDPNTYYEEGQLPPEGEEGYDEPPPEKRRGGLKTIVALVALAIVGTGGVYGYRSWTGSSATGGEPPVIRAEQGPAKVVPAAPNDNPLNKQIYDRIGDRGGERVVPREEQPVDVKSATRSIASGIGASGATGSVLPPIAAPSPAPAAAASEPRKVKTVAIRPDQSSGAAAPAPAGRAPVMTQSAPANSPPPARVATVPVTPAPAPTRSVAAEGGGTYMVQVASQLSEADAQSSFKVLQQKYPSVLGGQPMAVQRAELGEKIGVRYRARVGPFTAEQANELCSNLKSAGGQCVVHKN